VNTFTHFMDSIHTSYPKLEGKLACNIFTLLCTILKQKYSNIFDIEHNTKLLLVLIMMHSDYLVSGLCPLSSTPNRTPHFRNCICFHPQVK